MLTVACVLRAGGSFYNETWVTRLQRSVAKNLSLPHRFVCLTNLPYIAGITIQKLTESWPGWWSKIELFKPGQFVGPVLYMDLDMMACGNINALTGPWPGLMMLRDCAKYREICNSGLMHWNAVVGSVYEDIFSEFKLSPFKNMVKFSGINGISMFGDQGFTQWVMSSRKQQIGRWQDALNPNWFLEFSYLDRINPVVANDSYDRDVRICYSLGHPKFSDLPNTPIVQRHWER